MTWGWPETFGFLFVCVLITLANVRYQWRKRFGRVACVVLLILLFAACGKKPPVVAPTVVERVVVQEVKVPVPVKAEPPAELLAAVSPLLPIFVMPSDPQASSALTVEGERALRGLIEELLQRLAAWKAWATAP